MVTRSPDKRESEQSGRESSREPSLAPITFKEFAQRLAAAAGEQGAALVVAGEEGEDQSLQTYRRSTTRD